MNQTTANAALAAILAKPDTVRTYPPPYPGGHWKAVVVTTIGNMDDPVRPYAYVGSGETEQAAIDHLNALEAADMWSAESHEPNPNDRARVDQARPRTPR